jgi:phosphoribosyl 1,2-cyclic phosphodiesterase
MRFASLGSGSGGNALVVEVGESRILVDCGLRAKEAETRLARLGLAPADLDGILVTHEHDDHVGGVATFVEKHALKAWLTWGTWRASSGEAEEIPPWAVIIDSHAPFAVGDIEVHPMPVPHDAREPVQYVLSDGAVRLGVLTDVGAPTRHIVDMLSGCEGLVLECNHDPAMLARGPYPGWLKGRIGGPWGHLSNAQAATILEAMDRSRLRHVVAAHLSESNNTPALAREALATVLNCEHEWVEVADQRTGFDWREL